MGQQQILFVCTANECRSPSMEVAFIEAMAQLDGPVWAVSSRGSDVRASRPMCTVAASQFGTDARASALAAEHRSQPITLDDIDSHALIIAASRAERTAIARLRPAARTRVFTLLEALMLGADRPAAGETLDDALRAADPVTAYAAQLNARRGLVTVADRRAGGRKVQAVDVPDAHHRGFFSHRSMLRDLRSSIRVLAGDLTTFSRT